MAATPPRSVSPTPPRTIVVPKPGYNLQISPNLEALLQHDELTRRNNSLPSTYCASSTSGYPVSLLPPPPRVANGSRRVQRDQDSVHTARSREGQRTKSAAAVSGFRHVTDSGAAGQSPSGYSSRPVTPNPYLNPAPILRPIDTPDLDEVPTPRQQVGQSLPDEPKSDSTQVAPETCVHPNAPDSSHRPSSAFNKAEKIPWLGRDSLSLFSGSTVNCVKRDSDRRDDPGDVDAMRDRQMWRPPAALSPLISRPPSAFGDSDTATVAFSSKSATSYLHSLQQRPYTGPSETPPHITHPESSDLPLLPPLPPTLPLPCLHLPSVSMPPNSMQQRKSIDSVTGNDYLSFIDLFPPSTSDELNPCIIQDNSQEIRSSCRLQSISIPSSSPYSISRPSLSSVSLASMKFAPPSPTSSTVHQLSPTCPDSASSSSSVGLPSMIFALPSPSAERIPTRLQPLSDPPSPYSPLEFAPPPSPERELVYEPSLSTVPELISERGRKLRSMNRSKSSSPYHVHNSLSPLPPTTNELGANERADRIRRNRKLARVFGRTPGVESIADVNDPPVIKKSHSPSLAALLTKQKSHLHAVSVSVSMKLPGIATEPSSPWTENLLSPDGRRHSTPFASDFTLYVDSGRDGAPTKDPFRSRSVMDSPEVASARSFIDLSDEDSRDDDVSDLNPFTSCQNRFRRLHQCNSTPSLVESLDSEAQAEIERRQKREKLARLHRFLGSRVPPEAVNGYAIGPPLPPPAPSEGTEREHRLRGKKNALLNGFDRGKEELDEKEKALNVRRAQKMEKVFGTPPPQVLYHTRPSRPTMPLSQPASPTDDNPYVLHLDFTSPPPNPNKSAYVGKTLHRRGFSDSSRCLLPRSEDSPQSSPSSIAQSFAESSTGLLSGYQQALAQSPVYLNYQHSLNSLIDIIDRDDRRSLIELHRHFLRDEANESSEEEEAATPRRVSNATSLKSERRHSLPSIASITSLSSEFHTSPKTSRFQLRRRKAAKLTSFFGVDYRDLIHDILESIERGVEKECKYGTLQPQEVEVLMHRVRSLQKLRNSPLS